MLKGGQVLVGEDLVVCDLGIKDGLITAMGRYLASDRVCPTHDVRGKWVLPSFADVMHQAASDGDVGVAQRQLVAASERAAVGGVTLLCEQVQPKPWESVLASVRRRSADLDASFVDRCFAVRVMSGQLPTVEQLVEARLSGLAMLSVALSPRLDGFGLDDGELFLLLQRGAQAGVAIGLLPEHPLFGRAVPRQPVGVQKRMAEEITQHYTMEGEFCATARAIAVAEAAQSPLHVLGITTPESLALVRRARRRGVLVSGHAFAHSLLLHRAVYRRRRGLWYRPLPPLRDKEHVLGLWRQWARGHLDGVVVGSGAVPSGPLSQLEQEERGKNQALPMLPWAPAALLSRAQQASRFSLAASHACASTRPLAMLGFAGERGAIAVGAVADLVIMDPSEQERLGPKKPREAKEWNPLLGLRALRLPEIVVNRGAVVAERGKLVSTTPRGETAVPIQARTRREK